MSDLFILAARSVAEINRESTMSCFQPPEGVARVNQHGPKDVGSTRSQGCITGRNKRDCMEAVWVWGFVAGGGGASGLSSSH